MARPHPYQFACHTLPQLLWRRPVAVRRELSDPLLGRELLLYAWDKAAGQLPPAERVAPRQLHLSWHRVAGRPTVLVQLPAPQATGESHLAAIVYDSPDEAGDDGPLYDDEPDEPTDPDHLPELDDERLPRYFLLQATLGRSPDEAGTPTVVAELRGEQGHYALRPGPPAGRPDTAGRFLQALAELLGPAPEEVPFMRIVRG